MMAPTLTEPQAPAQAQSGISPWLTIPRRLHLALWAGLLLCVAHGWSPAVALVAPIAFLLALRGASARVAFYVGLTCGALEAMVLAGVLHAGGVLFLALCLDYALMRALVAVVIATASASASASAPAPGAAGARWWRPAARTAVAPAAWVVAEWLHCQLPYSLPNLLGDTQHEGLLLPFARLGGTFLISFLLVWSASLLLALGGALWGGWQRSRCQARRDSLLAVHVAVTMGVALAVVVALHLAAAASVPTTLGTSGGHARRTVRVNVVQGGLPTWLYTDAERRADWAGVPESVYEKLSRQAPPADLVVWPETAVWRFWGADRGYRNMLQRLATDLGADLLVGTPRRDEGGQLFNSAVVLTPRGDDPARLVDKRRLVVRAEGAFAPGVRSPIVDVAGVRLGVIFCLESVVPSYARDAVRAGAEWIVVLAEGSRMGQTPVARMHARRSIVRAVEVGRVLVHAGQHGYSTVVLPDGTAAPLRPAFAATVVSATLPIAVGQTPYVRWGAWIVGVSLGILFVAYLRATLARERARRRRTSQNSVA